MKKIIIYFIAAAVNFSCIDQLLEKKPLDMISDADLWDDETMADTYLTGVYLRMPILLNETPEPMNGGVWDFCEDWIGPYIINTVSDEARWNYVSVSQNSIKYTGLRISGGLLEWWEYAYVAIRRLNDFIERLPVSAVSDAFKTEKLAEARFLRAYNYFSMVKRYGGVPLVTRVQLVDDPYEELYRSRDSEQAIYDFVLSELDEIANDLPNDATTGRPTKAAALALRSRAAVYAGSIAQFGTIQLGGILGIDASKAQSYYQIAYDAAQRIMNETNHSLYDVNADKVLNFQNVFLVKASANNPEPIWIMRHTYTQKTWSGGNGWGWDFWNCPKPHAWSGGMHTPPYLEMAEEFEYVDGRPGKLDWDAIQEGFWTVDQLWSGRDPRFYASIWTQDRPWQSRAVDLHYGLVLPDGSVIRTSGSYEGVLIFGEDTGNGGNRTGFGIMKLLEESHDNTGERLTSGTDWQIIRFAEVLLNYAEAAFELGRTADALTAINRLRDRAGIAPLATIDREKIRHERKVELAFEGHRYWDLRRWRIAFEELNIPRSRLEYVMVFEEQNKYKLEVINADGTVTPPLFHDYNYYFPITLSRTSSNPNLTENPGYY